MDMHHFENLHITWFILHGLYRSLLQNSEDSLIVDVLILPIFSFSTHIHCGIDSVRTVFNKQVLAPTKNFDFQNRDHYFPELMGTIGKKRQRSDDHHLIFILLEYWEENQTFTFVANKLLYIFSFSCFHLNILSNLSL